MLRMIMLGLAVRLTRDSFGVSAEAPTVGPVISVHLLGFLPYFTWGIIIVKRHSIERKRLRFHLRPPLGLLPACPWLNVLSVPMELQQSKACIQHSCYLPASTRYSCCSYCQSRLFRIDVGSIFTGRIRTCTRKMPLIRRHDETMLAWKASDALRIGAPLRRNNGCGCHA